MVANEELVKRIQQGDRSKLLELWELRRSKKIHALRRYIDLRTDFYRSGFDPVASNVLWREHLEGQYTTSG